MGAAAESSDLVVVRFRRDTTQDRNLALLLLVQLGRVPDVKRTARIPTEATPAAPTSRLPVGMW